MVMSKRKGNSFERDIVNIFKKEFEDEGFMRTPHSGATFGKSNRYRMEGIDEGFSHQMTGDLVVPKKFPFSLECKAYKNFEFHQVLQGENKTLDKWIEQAKDDAEVSEKEMLIVMKFNRKGTYVCTRDLEFSKKDTVLTNYLTNFMYYKERYLIYTLDVFLSFKDSIDLIVKWKQEKTI